MSGMNDALIEVVQRIVRKESRGDQSTLATVEELSPLRVVLDCGDGTPLSITPLIGTSDPITEGARVVVTWAGKRAVITNVITQNIGTAVPLAPRWLAGGYRNNPMLHVGADGWCQVTGAWVMTGENGLPAISYGANVTVATVPVEYAPASIVVASATPFSSVSLITGGCRVTTGGDIQVYANNNHSGGTTTAPFPLTGLRWPTP